MNKKIILVLIIFLLSAISVSGLNTSIAMKTNNETINVWTNANSGTGNTNYYMDGKNFDRTVHEINNDINDDKDILQTIWQVFKEQRLGEKGLVNRPVEDLRRYEYKFRSVMESIFVTWNKFGQYFNQQQNQIQQLQLEIEALQKLHNDEDICNARMQVAQDNNISKITCGNTTYHAEGNNFVGFE